MKFFVNLLITALVAFVLSQILSGVNIENIWTAIAFALVLGILNAIVRPILVFLTLPATLITLGLFLFVINAAIILLADYFLSGFEVDGFWWALLLSILLSIVSSWVQKLVGTEKEKR